MTGSANALQNGVQMVVSAVGPMETVDPTNGRRWWMEPVPLKTADLSPAP
jgi:hypothetical protein